MSAMSRATSAAKSAFASRTPRERRLLAYAVVIVAAAALPALANGVWRERTRLAVSLPNAHSELSRMQEDAAELQRLRQLPAATAAAMPTLLDAARAGAASRGLALSIALSGETLQVRGTADFTTLVEWLANVHAELGLRPLRAAIAAQSAGVSVDVDLVRAAESP